MIYFIGIDVGTSGLKAILMNKNGEVTASTTSEYPMYTPKPLWSEQNPIDWYNAALDVLKNLISKNNIDKNDIKGIGLTGQMHGLVALDKNGDHVYPCIMWNDQRTQHECNEITKKIGFENLLSITGNPVLPGFTAPKLLWLRKNDPEAYSRINKIMLPKDYIRYKLTGEYYSEVSDASGTSLLDVKNRTWSSKILKELEIPMYWLPEVVESIEQTGGISKDIAEKTGLAEDTPVYAGGGDQAAGGIGAGIISEGTTSIVLGTSGVVFTHSKDFKIEPEGKLHAFCHSVPNEWHLMGVTLSAAGSFKWYKDVFGFEEKVHADKSDSDVYEILTASASTAPIGSEGLLYLPYLSGERTPYPDPNAKGSFIGFSIRHNKNHFTRAILEGVAYSIRDCFELMINIGITSNKIIASGGGAKSDFWLSIIADVLNVEINTLTCTEGAPYGAAIIASVGSGYYKSVQEAISNILKVDKVIKPNPENVKIYNDYYLIYKELYSQLKVSFDNITNINNKYYGN